MKSLPEPYPIMERTTALLFTFRKIWPGIVKKIRIFWSRKLKCVLRQMVPDWIQVPLATAIGIPIYVCATGSTPLVALLMHKGLSAGAAMAFLLAGSAANLTAWRMLTHLHGRRVL